MYPPYFENTCDKASQIQHCKQFSTRRMELWHRSRNTSPASNSASESMQS